MVTIMLADDYPVVRRGLRALLETEPDFQVVGEAADGLEAMSMALSLCPDIVLLDLIMKGISGIEITRKLSSGATRMGIIIFSMLGSEHYVLEALRAGARGYVLKEAPSEELIRAIREVAAGGRYIFSPLNEQLSLRRENGDGSFDLYRTLTAREREVLRLSVQGGTSTEVANRLNISRRTVETHRANMMRKLGASSLSTLYSYALQQGALLDDYQTGTRGIEEVIKG